MAEGRLEYDHMGSSEFKFGLSRLGSLKWLLTASTSLTSVDIKITDDISIKVWLVTTKDFPVDVYQLFLQEIADGRRRLKEPSNFDKALKATYGAEENQATNVWFDIENHVLWTLTEEDQKSLVAILQEIKKKWGIRDSVGESRMRG